jgi:bacillithiol system protein YtxJ
MTWIPLESEAQIEKIIADSEQKPQVIFKHSTRCSISSMAKNRLTKKNAPEGIDFYYLDLIQFRKLSNRIASDFKVTHQSPQILIIHHGKCIYHESHSGITMEEIEEVVSQHN